MEPHRTQKCNRTLSSAATFAGIAAISGIFLGACEDGPTNSASTAVVDAPSMVVLDEDKHTGKDLQPEEGMWKGEVFAEAAGSSLKQLAKILKVDPSIPPSSVSELATAEIRCDMTAVQPTVVYSDGTLTIRAFDRGDEVIPNAARGHEAFAKALQSLKNSFGDSQDLDVSFKIVGLEGDAVSDGWLSTIRYESRVRRRDSHLQQRGKYACKWSASGNGPRLTEIRLLQWEEAESSDSRPWFSDHTAAVLGQNDALRTQFSFGLDHWLRRISRVHGMTYFKRHGIAVGDANGDHLDDVYICQGGGLSNKLFIQQPDGTALDVSQQAGVDFLDHTASALFIDLDNDGDQDLVLATFEGVLVLSNAGDARFDRQAHLPFTDRDLHALSSVDFDDDGDLDLYVTVDYAVNPPTRFLYHDANDGGRNRLFRNDGAWKFTDVTAETGLDVRNQRHSLSASWEDADNDGDMDLYVANDYGQNCFYINQDGVFDEVAAGRGVIDYGSGMSVTWGDTDRDGNMDLYVGNMFSSAGSRIVTKSQFLPNASTKNLYRRFVRGNSLYRNVGNASFTEESNAGGASQGRWSWSSIFADLNNDGWEDLFAANGYITTEDTGDL